ncbi:putative membrane protein [Serratia plymuthica A30]|nr:putative membrane protein [Serratia plymuthica A30]
MILRCYSQWFLLINCFIGFYKINFGVFSMYLVRGAVTLFGFC